jgi:hypothetical protein
MSARSQRVRRAIDLAAVRSKALARDAELKIDPKVGPQRAELVVRLDGAPVKDRNPSSARVV